MPGALDSYLAHLHSLAVFDFFLALLVSWVLFLFPLSSLDFGVWLGPDNTPHVLPAGDM